MVKLTVYGAAEALFAPLYWPGNLVLKFAVLMMATAIGQGADRDHCIDVARPLVWLARALWWLPRAAWALVYDLLDRGGFVDAHDAACGHGEAS